MSRNSYVGLGLICLAAMGCGDDANVVGDDSNASTGGAGQAGEASEEAGRNAGGEHQTAGTGQGGAAEGGAAEGGSAQGGTGRGGAGNGGQSNGGSGTGGAGRGGGSQGGTGQGGTSQGGAAQGGAGEGGLGTGGASEGGAANGGSSDGGSGLGGSGLGGIAELGGTSQGGAGIGGVSEGGASGGATESGGSANGGSGGDGGSGGVVCEIQPQWCNWCGGGEVHDSNGCYVQYICENGVDPCETDRCELNPVCTENETCGEDGLCWPNNGTHVALGRYSPGEPEPCTTDPCLPGTYAAIVTPDETYYLIINGHRIIDREDWDDWTGEFVPNDGQNVIADGKLVYHTDIHGRIYLDLELTELTPRLGEE